MESNKEVSDLTMSRSECEKCGATWINGQHVFRGTAASYDSSELDLAGLVCNRLGNEQCINPKKGIEGGQTWESRSGYVQGAIDTRKKMLEELADHNI